MVSGLRVGCSLRDTARLVSVEDSGGGDAVVQGEENFFHRTDWAVGGSKWGEKKRTRSSVWRVE